MTSMMDLLLAVEMVMTTTLVRTMTFTWRGEGGWGVRGEGSKKELETENRDQRPKTQCCKDKCLE